MLGKGRSVCDSRGMSNFQVNVSMCEIFAFESQGVMAQVTSDVVVKMLLAHL